MSIISIGSYLKNYSIIKNNIIMPLIDGKQNERKKGETNVYRKYLSD